jgi:hypothetical protein
MAKILKALIGICVICFVPTVVLGQTKPEILTPKTETLTFAEETVTPKIKEEIGKIEAKKEAISPKIKESLEKARKTLEEKSEEIQKKIQIQREILTKRLEKISEKKRPIVERIYERVNELNKRMTDHYLDVLEKLGMILGKIESRAEKFKAQGVDTSEVEKCIESAQLKIEKVKETVLAQAQKVYSAPQITTEKNLKLNVGVIRKQLHNDLRAVEKSVKDARSATQNCAVLLGKVAETKQQTTTPATTTLETPTLPTPTPATPTLP